MKKKSDKSPGNHLIIFYENGKIETISYHTPEVAISNAKALIPNLNDFPEDIEKITINFGDGSNEVWTEGNRRWELPNV